MRDKPRRQPAGFIFQWNNVSPSRQIDDECPCYLVTRDLSRKMRTDLADRFAYMVDGIVDASDPRGRVDIRRRWSGEAKGRIVAESYAPGAVVSEVAQGNRL